MTDPQRAQEGIADALGRLSEETRVLVRAELEQAQTEAWSKLKQAAPGLGLVAVGGALGVAAGASAYRVALRALEKPLPPLAAAVVAMVGFAGGSVVAITTGLQQLRESPLPLPSETAREGADAMAEAAEHVA